MHVLRSLSKSPVFASVAVLTIALGIGSATAIYSVANAVVFRPLPFRDEASLAWIWSTRPDRDRAFFSVPNFLDLKQQTRTFEDLASITPVAVTLTGSGEPERVLGSRVSPNLFSILGAEPQVGRFPPTADDAAHVPAVAVLGHGFWQRRFGGDAAIVGRALNLNGRPHVVVAVLRPDFVIPHVDTDVVIAQSLQADPRLGDRATSFLRGIGRLRPGVSLSEAQAEFVGLNQQLVRLFPDTNAAVTAPRLVPLRDELVGSYRSSLLLLLAAAGTLLLIMCANLAGLLAARALGRRRDAALCSALGASPARLMRMYLSEGFAIAIAGGVVGVVACAWGLDALLALAPTDLPRANQVAIDARVLALAFGCTLLTGLGVGLAPAIRLARVAPQDVLKGSSLAATARTPARTLLVIAQIALCTVLLIGTGLLVRSLHRLLQSQPGFTTAGVLTAQVSLPEASYRAVGDVVNFSDTFAQRLRALPGVSSIGLTHILPLTGINSRSEFARVDRPPVTPADTPSAANRFISEGFFATLGIPLRAGRDFRASDDATGRPVVIIDQAVAERHWPGEDPLGKVIRIRDGMSPQPRDLEIIGIAGPTKNFSLEEAGTPTIYLPFRQMVPAHLPFFRFRAIFVLKTAGEPLALAETVRRALRDTDAGAAIVVRSYDDLVAWARAPRIFNLYLLGFFSASAVLLAELGLYAITSQAVTARTREIGIRMALGANRRRIAREVLGGTARTIVTGIAAGAMLAAALSPLFARMLYHVRAFDPMTYGSVAAALAAIAFAAAWLPARRAMRVDPIVALRTE